MIESLGITLISSEFHSQRVTCICSLLLHIFNNCNLMFGVYNIAHFIMNDLTPFMEFNFALKL